VRVDWVGRPSFPGFTAEVEVCLDGRVRRGRVIVGPDGRIHLEHLDPAAARWCRRQLQGRGPAGAAPGWDSRAERCRRQQKPRRVWVRRGPFELLAGVELNAAAGAARRLRLTGHRLLGGQP
jgi:hypothetical protein